ncbi:hypothetical protein LPJ77_003351 [Coemansia sp. RSA 2523]|nr:hypothetical protein LPJ58_003351 [Coemansia sp. RSA 1591]KAJ1760701.1 hypothetical protein LPJ69_003321 [Coemansia sp. RSA 1752]KAJ1776652.1 hypothetical protein LPJ54_002931 [Coemansia sp. RSA 1824]KAJ1788066.1 hypothetical protein LPJ62_003057 [Coemansia sp. RSA 2167]KAJ1806882.1 hypothetical protein LPJ77_003351 [Coemansia sp. RSA 2523]KAJ2143370.1 hypothetical protein IW142_003761 [Coemansia sp. RSA 564]KAJ2169598.1 hypothetical protein GGH15_000396 [Coemansia sp. RSA 562]KAJ2182361.
MILSRSAFVRIMSMPCRGKHSSVNMNGGLVRKAMQQFREKPEVLVYDRKLKDTHYKWAPWVAGGQLLVFLNFADFYWRYSMDQDEDGELVLAPTWKRASISGIALVAGVGIGGGILHFLTRSVARMKVVDRGSTVVLETYKMTGRGTKMHRYPMASMFSRDKLCTGLGEKGVTKTGSPQYSLRAKGDPYAYILNREGEFIDPQLFDTLFQRAAYVYTQ